MYSYLVVRKNCLYMRDGDYKIRNSTFWPMVITSHHALSVEEVLRKALDSISEGYTPEYEYVVVPMRDASVVSLRKPQPQYEIHVRRFDAN